MSRPDRDEIVGNVRAFIKGASNDDELEEVMCDYVEECMDEGAPHVSLRKAKPKAQATDAAVAIEIYDRLIEAQSTTPGQISKQMAYQIATSLLRSYEFYEKEIE